MKGKNPSNWVIPPRPDANWIIPPTLDGKWDAGEWVRLFLM